MGKDIFFKTWFSLMLIVAVLSGTLYPYYPNTAKILLIVDLWIWAIGVVYSIFKYLKTYND